MKTPDGIKNELKKYASGEEWDVSKECAKLCKRALAYIKRLEANLQREKEQHQYTIDAANIMKDEALKFESRLAKAEREKDSALQTIRDVCAFCKGKGFPTDCERCMLSNYRSENTKEETDD